MKKTLAILLSLALVICMIPGTAFATPISDGETIDSVSVADIASQVYTGTTITPEPIVTAVIKDAQSAIKTVTLVKGTDYEVTYSDNVNVGTTATVTVSFIGAFSAQTEITKTFAITALDLSNSNVTITAGETPITDVETAVNNVVVKLNGTEITQGFTKTAAVSTSDAGTILVTITANEGGNFTGTKTAAFYKRTEFDSTYAVTATTLTYTGSTLSPTLYFTKEGKAISLVAGTDYTVSYEDVVNAGACTINVTGIGKYAGTITGSFTINPKSISGVSVTIPNVAQNGTISPIVKDGTKTLVYGTDYTYVIPDTSITGSKTINITGLNNYTGTKSASYTVIDAGKVFDAANVTFGTTTPYYTGYYQYKDVTVKVGNKVLTKDVDYKVTYTIIKDKVTTTNSYALDAGTYTVTVTGIGSYSGTATSSFTIVQIPIEYVTATASAGYYTNSPNVTVRSAVNGVTFVVDKDYTVYSWTSTYLKKCYVTITSTGTGNLGTGTIEKEFSILGKNLSYCTAEFANGSKQYNNYSGSVIKPTVRVRDGYTTLTQGTDYSVLYKDAAGKTVTSPKDAGPYTIVITGEGAYSGTLTLYFYINGTDISNYTVTLKDSSVKADGYAKTPAIETVKSGYYNILSSSDYVISYEDAAGNTVYSMKTPGIYKIVVTGKGGYSGSTYAYFTIKGEPQEISIAKTSYKVYKDSDSFKISAKATGDGTGFSYVSSDPTVASVSSTGVVTIHKIGRAKITVTTTGMKKSDPVSDEVFVKVYPDKATISKKPWTEGKKGSLRVRWDIQEDATYYEVRYSRDKAFKKGTYKTKKVTASEKYDTQSTALKDLYSGKTYYVKVRAVKVVYNDFGEELKYYGTWSGWRSAKTK